MTEPSDDLWIWECPYWIRDGKLNTLGCFCFSDCWLSGIGFRIPEFFRCLKYWKTNVYNFTIRWLLDLRDTSLEQNLRLKTLGYLLFIPSVCFYRLLGCPIANFLRKQSHSPYVNHCILPIYFWPKGDWEGLGLYI